MTDSKFGKMFVGSCIALAIGLTGCTTGVPVDAKYTQTAPGAEVSTSATPRATQLPLAAECVRVEVPRDGAHPKPIVTSFFTETEFDRAIEVLNAKSSKTLTGEVVYTVSDEQAGTTWTWAMYQDIEQYAPGGGEHAIYLIAPALDGVCDHLAPTGKAI